MLSRARIYAGILGLALLSSHAFGQEQVDPVQKLIKHYEAMSDKERVTFLQAIALIGLKKSEALQTPAELEVLNGQPARLPPTETLPPATSVPASIANPQSIPQAQVPVILESASPSPIVEPQPVVAPPSEKPRTNVDINLPEPTDPHPDAEIQAAVAPTPTKLLNMPQPTPPANLSIDASESAAPVVIAAVAKSTSTELSNQNAEQTITRPSTNPGHKKSIRVIASQQIDYAFSGSSNPANSVFGLLLPEYQQKLNNAGVKIEIDDLRIEAINFYISSLESKISDCGYQVVKNDDPASTQVSPLQLETGIQRIVINKTLFETALIGEANAKLSNKQQVLSSVQARSTKALTEYDNLAQRSSELKIALTQSVGELTNQVANKICGINLN